MAQILQRFHTNNSVLRLGHQFHCLSANGLEGRKLIVAVIAVAAGKIATSASAALQ
jgi:hypothetical protein